MSWVTAALFSALFLGFYDLCTKLAVKENAVLPVLFLSNLCSAAVWSILILLQRQGGVSMPALLVVAPMTAHQHLLVFLKSALVATSWVCTYFAIKHLPMSLAAPIRATGPLWTLVGALVILAERPHGLEIWGIVVTLASFVGLSFSGGREGVRFHKDPWVGVMIGGTLLNGASGLYDKFLMARNGFGAATVQAWFSIYLACVFLPLVLGWKFRLWQRHEFHWRWAIIGVSFMLLIADFVYFNALRDPEALVSVVSCIRRGSTLVAFLGGLWLFKETNVWKRLPAVLGVLTGIVLTVLGRR